MLASLVLMQTAAFVVGLVAVHGDSNASSVPIFGAPFHENSCEVVKPEQGWGISPEPESESRGDCMKCIIVVSQNVRQVNEASLSLAPQTSNGYQLILEEEGSAYYREVKFNVTPRFYCETNRTSVSCEDKPLILVQSVAPPRGHVTIDDIVGFEISLVQVTTDENADQRKQTFLEIVLDSRKYRDFDYPHIELDFVPQFKFEPGVTYRLSVNALPKHTYDELRGRKREMFYTSPQLPPDVEVRAQQRLHSWPLKPEPNCSNLVWCVMGSPECELVHTDELGGGLSTAKSFLIALSVSLLFLLFFAAVVAAARYKVKSLSPADDTEFLYEDDDLYEAEEHQARSNDTEMATMGSMPHRGQLSLPVAEVIAVGSSLSSHVEEPAGHRYTVNKDANSRRQAEDHSSVQSTGVGTRVATSEFLGKE